MKKGRPPSEVSSQALLDVAKSISFNTKNYIPKDGSIFTLFSIEILAGLTVALALVPEAIAFAFVAGVSPKVGLYAAFMMGLITSIFGGRPGMISGATGAVAVIFTPLVAKIMQASTTQGLSFDQGMEMALGYLFAAVILMGLIQILFGVLKLGNIGVINTM